MDIKVGDRIRYESVAGIIYGEVVKIMQDKNNLNEMIDWIYIEHFNPKSPTLHSIARIAKVTLEQMNPRITAPLRVGT